MSTRVSPVERIRADIDDLFASERDLGDVLEEVARLGVRLLMQTAIETEVTEFLGRERYAHGERAGRAAVMVTAPRPSRRPPAPSPSNGRTGGSSPDNDGTGRHRQTARVRQARRKGVRVQNPVVEPPQARDTGSNLTDVGGPWIDLTSSDVVLLSPAAMAELRARFERTWIPAGPIDTIGYQRYLRPRPQRLPGRVTATTGDTDALREGAGSDGPGFGGKAFDSYVVSTGSMGGSLVMRVPY